MAKYASKVVEQAKAWIGCKESNGTHKQIIDVYNSHKPLARGYKVKCKANGDKVNDAWCATFVSAVAVKLGYTAIIPTECSCSKMIELFKSLGAWNENDARTPNPGDIIFYDWEDNGVGDNKGNSDHVGIVEKVSGNTITIIEGNYSKSVKRRTLKVNGKYIRGYGVPKYDKEIVPPVTTTNTKEVCTVNVKQLSKGSKGNAVKALQTLLIGYGYSCGKSGVDGSFGGDTLSAVKQYQKAKGLTVDGVVGAKTWGALLGV